MEKVFRVTRCSWWRALTSVIIFPLVLFLSRWLALFCFCCSTRSLVVRYSRANSLRILLKRWMLTSRTAYTGWPRNRRNAWNLQMYKGTAHHCTVILWQEQGLNVQKQNITDTYNDTGRRNSDEVFGTIQEMFNLITLFDLNIPVDYPSMYNLQNDDPLGTVFEEVGHFLFQRWFHLVFRNDLEVIPWCFAPSLHLGQIVLKLIKVHLTTVSQDELTPDCWELFSADVKIVLAATINW